MATFTAIVTAHEDEAGMVRAVDALLAQSRKPDEIIVLASDIDCSVARKRYTGVTFYQEPNLNDWGHDKRAKGLDLATSDYAGWFNHDDSYDPHYIAEMMWQAELGHDVVYCGWSKASTPQFRSNISTSGNYVVKVEVARRAGYTDRHYEADGTFINRIAEATNSIKFLPGILYFHNEVK
jgi:glycosyltransferase involved in cell wall biosynthesis